jgi:NAD+ synthase
MLEIDCQKVSQQIELYIREKVKELRRDGAIIGISGGLDSAVVTGLAVMALGRERVFGLIMPERDSSPLTVEHARLVAKQFNIPFRVVRLTPLLRQMGIYRFYPPVFFIPRAIQNRYVLRKHEELKTRLDESPLISTFFGTQDKEMRKGVAYFRSKHRLRMTILYFHAERLNFLVVGTSNRSEWLIGFFVPYGDGAADIMPMLPFFKTQVRVLGEYLGVPEKILKKPPSPDLMPGLTDEEAIGMEYEDLDLILDGLERGTSPEKVARQTGIPLKDVQYVQKLTIRSRHLREMPEALSLDWSIT